MGYSRNSLGIGTMVPKETLDIIYGNNVLMRDIDNKLRSMNDCLDYNRLPSLSDMIEQDTKRKIEQVEFRQFLENGTKPVSVNDSSYVRENNTTTIDDIKFKIVSLIDDRDAMEQYLITLNYDTLKEVIIEFLASKDTTR